MKKLISLLFALTLLPVAVFAGGNVIGTGVFHTLNSVPNLYYQHKLGDKSAIVIGYGSVNNFDLGGSFGTLTATAIGLSYKGYLGDYADGAYYQVGGASVNVSSSSAGAASGIYPTAVVGYEATMGKNFVVGGEVGLGTANGFGILGINAGFIF